VETPTVFVGMNKTFPIWIAGENGTFVLRRALRQAGFNDPLQEPELPSKC
jgi:hypothetical protein